MSKCKQCGFELGADVRYCPNCAAKVDPSPQPAGASDAFTGTISGTATIFAPERADSCMDLETGKEFHERYKIERKLGQGAMGVVYLGGDKLTGRQVALKLINPVLMNSASARERFLREGLIARDIRHKNVVAVYDVNQTQGQYYLVMEYLSGENLRNCLHNFIQSGNDVPYETAEKIIRNILEGLDAAHASGVVHRDVKPENIMLTGNVAAGDYSLKILDFGIARAIDNSARQGITTTTSTGTALYMAPEQKTAADTVGPPADLYAASAIFYELLLGVAPAGRWAPLSKEREDLPPGIDDVINKGLSSRPRSRYQSAREYLRAIGEIRVEPLPSPAPEPPQPPVQPAPPVQPVQPVLPPPTPQPRRSIKKRWIAIGAAVLFGLWLIVTLANMNNPPSSTTTLQQTPIPQPIPAQTPVPTPQPPPVEKPVQIQGEGEKTDTPYTPSNANFSGTWYDELEGTGIAQYRIVLQQNGQLVTGTMYDMNGFSWGTISGFVKGNVLSYKYQSKLGNGWGEGTMAPDGDVDVIVNGAQRRVMHRNHLPG
jgi:serine/threonine protein kinase